MAIAAICKLFYPAITVNGLSLLFAFDVHESIAILTAALTLALSLLYIFGIAKAYTYGIATFIYFFIVFFTISPWAHFSADKQAIFCLIPLVCGSLALFMMRSFDTKLVLDKKKSLFS